MDLLMRLKQKGSLPAVSDKLGYDVRTNSESIVGVRFPGKQFDMSKGIAIGSGIYIDRFTHIEATRYSKGSDVLGLLATMLVTGRGWGRIFKWFGSFFRHPIRFAGPGSGRSRASGLPPASAFPRTFPPPTSSHSKRPQNSAAPRSRRGPKSCSTCR
jgi:hypothetical protein